MSFSSVPSHSFHPYLTCSVPSRPHAQFQSVPTSRSTHRIEMEGHPAMVKRTAYSAKEDAGAAHLPVAQHSPRSLSSSVSSCSTLTSHSMDPHGHSHPPTGEHFEIIDVDDGNHHGHPAHGHTRTVYAPTAYSTHAQPQQRFTTAPRFTASAPSYAVSSMASVPMLIQHTRPEEAATLVEAFPAQPIVTVLSPTASETDPNTGRKKKLRSVRRTQDREKHSKAEQKRRCEMKVLFDQLQEISQCVYKDRIHILTLAIQTIQKQKEAISQMQQQIKQSKKHIAFTVPSIKTARHSIGDDHRSTVSVASHSGSEIHTQDCNGVKRELDSPRVGDEAEPIAKRQKIEPEPVAVPSAPSVSQRPVHVSSGSNGALSTSMLPASSSYADFSFLDDAHHDYAHHHADGHEHHSHAHSHAVQHSPDEHAHAHEAHHPRTVVTAPVAGRTTSPTPCDSPGPFLFNPNIAHDGMSWFKEGIPTR